VLVGDGLEDTGLHFDSAAGVITAIGADAPAERVIDASGLLVLPGIVDVHGDAFERQLMPRPGVGFPLDIALLESDRQAVANGITTVFHGVTWSWEGGLRGAPTRAITSGTRPTISTPNPRSWPGSQSAASTPSRSTTT
jgi:alpha-D-ribose 1-methylphosphonate 5-triphosphate diphosphatase